MSKKFQPGDVVRHNYFQNKYRYTVIHNIRIADPDDDAGSTKVEGNWANSLAEYKPCFNNQTWIAERFVEHVTGEEADQALARYMVWRLTHAD